VRSRIHPSLAAIDAAPNDARLRLHIAELLAYSGRNSEALAPRRPRSAGQTYDLAGSIGFRDHEHVDLSGLR
jgi:hypothetical protein